MDSFEEQRLILGIFVSSDEKLCVDRMRQHLRGVQDAIERWNPEDHPVE